MKAIVTATINNSIKANVTAKTTNSNSDHAKLKNLDYESSGHTGFVSQIELEEKLANIKLPELQTETWEFTLEDGSTVQKVVYVK